MNDELELSQEGEIKRESQLTVLHYRDRLL
jgi:hypothetical protein